MKIGWRKDYTTDIAQLCLPALHTQFLETQALVIPSILLHIGCTLLLTGELAVKRNARPLLILVLCLPLLAQTRQIQATQHAAAHVPVTAVTSTAQTDQGNPEVRVWVNTASGVYHCPGSRWYGNTKRGEYMTQAEAQKKHYRPANGKVCR